MNSKVKLVIAVICLAAAGVVLAMNFGLLGGGPAKPKGTQPTNQGGAASTTGGTTGTTEEQPAGTLKRERN